ncbi:MAG: 3-phosphoshikimate 1-carboxyvinyltransferase [Nanoarchaeota archaeon]
MIEITPIQNLDAAVSVPGSKYIANRLLIICSLANGTSILKNIPDNEDINNSIKALQQFGIKIEKKEDNLTITGTGKLKSPKNEINVGDSGTLLRFITAFSALAKGKTKITGSKRIQERPISELLKSLNDLGTKSSSKNGNAPLTINGGNLEGGKTKIKGSISSQFISALLLISPFARKDVEISIEGKLVSLGYVDLTINLMKEFGVNVERSGSKFTVKANQKYKSKNFTVPSDWASANYFLAAAAIVPGIVTINNLDLKSKVPESGFFRLLEKMGCKVLISENSIKITGTNKLRSIDADMSSMPDSVQTLAIVAIFADGTTRIKNIENLKFKESDRINDTANELRKLGADVKVRDDELVINKSKLNSAIIDSHNDHRMAMSFAVAGLKIPGIKISNPECVNKSFPQFFDKLNRITAKKQKNIVLIGYRGAGKTCTAKELSKLTGMNAISTDEEISKKVGMPIGDFIDKKGWGEFRKAECEVVESLKGIDRAIIDCGGGVVENDNNIKLIKQNGTVFWLRAQVSVLADRIKDTKNRPSLTGKKSFIDEIDEVLARRIPLYRKASDFEVDTSNETPLQIAELIIKLHQNQPMKTKICAVIAADNVKDALSDMAKAESADLTELRLDFIKNIDENKIKELMNNKKQKIIVTCRPVQFGGLFKGNEKERIALLNKAIELKADFVDVEFGSEIATDIIKNKKSSKIIISHHDFKETPSLEKLESIYSQINKLNPDFVKIVTAANSINDNFIIFNLLKGKNNLVSFCMDQKGEISRILASKFGSVITYCSLGKNKESASGQITLEEMNKLYHIDLINKETNVIGIIGEFAENSMSKYMHNPNFVKNSINFVYVPFKVAPSELKEFMENFKSFNFKGAAVTIPHKENIINLIHNVDETADEIGAVNTLVRDNGKIIGYNTDYYGAVMTLKEKMNIKSKKILIIGAGGAARAVVYGLKKGGAEITIVNRTESKAKELAEEFHIDFDKMENIKSLTRQADIIVNTTSMGMTPFEDRCALKEDELPEGKIVMDVVYKPVNTKLIRMANKKGCKTITGDRMLIYQAVRQFELWTKINPGFKEMEKELNKHI